MSEPVEIDDGLHDTLAIGGRSNQCGVTAVQLITVQRREQFREQFSVSKSTYLGIALVGAFSVLALAACGSDEPQVAAPVAPVKRQATPEDPTAKMARAVTVSGATVPVSLKYDILGKPLVGSPVEIELAVISTQGADSLAVAFAGSAGLTVSPESAPSIDKLQAGQIERVKFVAQAQQETVFYVTVTATVFSGGVSSARSFAIPIIMTAPVAATEPTATAQATSATKS